MDPQKQYVLDAHRDFDEQATFCRESLTIRDKHGRTVPFEPGPAQLRLFDAIEKCRREGRPARILYLKARQVWVSTGTATEIFRGCAFTPGQKAMIVSHEADSTANIFGYYKQLQEAYQPFRGLISTLLAKILDGEHAIEWEGGGYVRVATANNLKTGRSYSLRFLHLSEFAFWKDAKTLMLGLMQAVPHDADTCVVIESTANGVGGEFYRLWMEASDPNSASEWIPLFFAWHEHPEYVIEPGDRAGFQSSLTKEELQLQRQYNLTLAQLNWRRWCIANNCAGDDELFKQEYPSCPEEAFLKSGRPRFSLAHLARMPVIRGGGTVGELNEIQNGPRSILRFFPQERGLMMVYELPKEGHKYVAGCDICEGIDADEKAARRGGRADPDYSVCNIVDRATGVQVAKLRGRLEPAAFAEYVDAVARFYNWAFLVPEANGPGIAFLEAMLRLDYPPGLIYHRAPAPDEQFSDQQSTILQKLGWRTSSTSRLLLISEHDRHIRDFSIFIRDPYTLSEHESFVIKSTGKAEHQDGCHDDEVFSLALAGIGIAAAPAGDSVLTQLMRERPGGMPKAGSVRSYGSAHSDTRGTRVRI